MGASFAQRRGLGPHSQVRPRSLTFLSKSSGPAEAGQRTLTGRKLSSGGPQQSPGFFLREMPLDSLSSTQVQELPALDPAHPC